MESRLSRTTCGWLSAALCGGLPAGLPAQLPYQQPPPGVLAVLDAPVTPAVSLAPTGDRMLLIERERYPAISELAQPMLGLAGIRFNPQNRGPHRPPQNVGISVRTIPAGETAAVALPPGAAFGTPAWAPDGTQFEAAGDV